jgi:ABC-type multidrug transport system fused ATPase/permease subunit
MTEPKSGIIIGMLSAIGSGAMTPIFGIVLMKVTFALNILYGEDYVREQANKWCLYMLLMAIGAFIFQVIGKFMFGALGENVTEKIRKQMYTSVLQKHTGWFDDKENTPGVISTSLASDA